MGDLDIEKRFLGFALSETPFERLSSFLLRLERGRVPQKALRSRAGMVPLDLPRGERSEDRERIFLAGKNSRLSEGLSRAFLDTIIRGE